MLTLLLVYDVPESAPPEYDYTEAPIVEGLMNKIVLKFHT